MSKRERQIEKTSTIKRIIRIPRVRPWRIELSPVEKARTGGLSLLVLVYGFAGLIILGTILLILPVSSKTGVTTHFINALFTSTSAVCVTGLVVFDTADYWSIFGQIVILVLIQLGGFGFMTSATLFIIALGHRIGLRERLLIKETLGLSRLSGLITLIKRMALFTALIEVLGAIILFFGLLKYDPFPVSLWKALFQSVSAFNNAGFDIFGGFRSMSGFQGDAVLVLVTAFLIFMGGISFLVLSDLITSIKQKRLLLNTRLVIITTLSLLVVGTIAILVLEYGNADTIGQLPMPQKLLNAFFQSVTARTAGFSTISMSNSADYTLFFIMILMYIGGAAGSTAGGIKVNTFGLITATILSTIRGKEYPGAFGREFTYEQISRALSIALLSLGLIAVIVFVLNITENFQFIQIFFETVSAFGTVGLSTGITPYLSLAGKITVIITMFVGRIGPLTMALAFTGTRESTLYRHPTEEIRIG